MAGNRNIP
jgi:hypothetical protein